MIIAIFSFFYTLFPGKLSLKRCYMRILYWFRADLRLADNIGLHHAITQASELLALYVITPKTWQSHHAAACKVQFILNHLQALSQKLAEKGIPLLIRETATFASTPLLIKKLCVEHQIDALFFNKQYEVDEKKRDKNIHRTLNKTLTIKSYDDQCVLAPGLVKSQQDQPLQIFTPFKKTWLHIANDLSAWKTLRLPQKIFHSSHLADPIPKTLKGWKCIVDLTHWPAGEEAAEKRLNHFCHTNIFDYHHDRDFPAKTSTSQLSPYLAQGVISPRQCIQKIMTTIKANHFSDVEKHPGCATWLSELIWRDFYKHIVFFHPKVCCYKAFRPHTDKLPWGNNPTHYRLWCEGKTGFPLVDAAMRQLNQTGWMHNRLRMVVAMFFSKTLFLDWRLGERYFMQHLIDGDLAANNGGWQWSASTGTDSVPYFRIFNPTTQSQRFDPNGNFIRTYCPELASLNNKTIHAPIDQGIDVDTLHYPKPIVCYKTMRKKVIDLFRQ
jgi:deoxyribodipyrimidine photo-lyase